MILLLMGLFKSMNCVYIDIDIIHFSYSDRSSFGKILLIVLQLLSLLCKRNFPKQLHCIHMAL